MKASRKGMEAHGDDCARFAISVQRQSSKNRAEDGKKKLAWVLFWGPKQKGENWRIPVGAWGGVSAGLTVQFREKDALLNRRERLVFKSGGGVFTSKKT